MIHPNIKYWRAVATMIGAIVGVGVFGLPYTFGQSGVAIGLISLAVIAVLLTVMQLMYAEVVVQTGGQHRLVGHVRKFFGKPWDIVALIIIAVSIWGAMTAYVIVGGRFLNILAEPLFGGNEVVFSIIIGVAAGLMMGRGLKFASKIEVPIVLVLLFLFIFLSLAAIPFISLENLRYVNIENAFVPYGVLLFALAGIGIVPEMRAVLTKRQEKTLPHAIITALVIIVSIYAIFSVVVVGATGLETTQTAFDGLIPLLGDSFRIVTALLGTITILSIYMILGIELQNMLKYDFRLHAKPAWLIVATVPVVLYVLGLREFIELVSFVGGVFVSMLGIMIVLTYEKMRKSPICRNHHCLELPKILSWLVILLFVGALIIQLRDIFG